MQGINCFSGHAACKKSFSIPGRLLPDDSKACRECSHGAQYLSGAPALRANSLTHRGGLHHRRSVSPAWQYGP